MPNAEKLDKVAALKARIEGSEALLLAEYRGLSVHDATELRRSLSETARFAIVKNTLMQRAADQAGIEELETLLAGPTAVAFVHGDVVAAAKKVVDAAKRFPALVLKGAYMEGKVLDARAAQALATLESREVMLSRIAGMLKSEMTRAASMFQALQGRFVGLLEAYREKVPGAEATEAEASAEAPTGAAAPADAAAEPEPAETESTEVEAAAEPEAAAEQPEAAVEPEAAVAPELAEPAGPSDGPAAEASAEDVTTEVEASAQDEEE